MEEAPKFLEEGGVGRREGGQRDCLQGALAYGAHCFPLSQTCTGANGGGRVQPPFSGHYHPAQSSEGNCR